MDDPGTPATGVIYVQEANTMADDDDDDDTFLDGLEDDPSAWDEENEAYHPEGSGSEWKTSTIDDLIADFIDDLATVEHPEIVALKPVIDTILERDWFDAEQENTALASAFVVAFLILKRTEGIKLNRQWLEKICGQCLRTDARRAGESN